MKVEPKQPILLLPAPASDHSPLNVGNSFKQKAHNDLLVDEYKGDTGPFMGIFKANWSLEYATKQGDLLNIHIYPIESGPIFTYHGASLAALKALTADPGVVSVTSEHASAKPPYPSLQELKKLRANN